MSESINTSKKRLITGPTWIYFNTKGELLVVIEKEWEKQNKSRKRAWQLFVPAGKQREGDTIEDTLLRETEEETGIKRDLLEIQFLEPKGKIELETEDAQLIMNVFEYNKLLDSNILEKNSAFFVHEIVQRTFLNIRDILEFDQNKIRPWLYEILYVFLWGKIEERIYSENGEYKKSDKDRIDALKKEIENLL